MIYPSIPDNFHPHFKLASCFVEHDGKMLLLHRNDTTSQGGKWGQPAGKVEEGENVIDAAVREIFEETGIKVNLNQLVHFKEIYVHHDGRNFTDTMFSVVFDDLPSVTLNLREHQDFGWFTPSEALSLHSVDDLDECVRMFYNL
jgi:8-oxo-dGTP pyrophosphatase MutT (NUDIX family)